MSFAGVEAVQPGAYCNSVSPSRRVFYRFLGEGLLRTSQQKINARGDILIQRRLRLQTYAIEMPRSAKRWNLNGMDSIYSHSVGGRMHSSRHAVVCVDATSHRGWSTGASIVKKQLEISRSTHSFQQKREYCRWHELAHNWIKGKGKERRVFI